MRRPLIAGNWKMHKTRAETHALLTTLLPMVADAREVDIVVAPPFTALAAAAQELRGSNVALGAQDLFWERVGAYTGEIAPDMLVEVGCQYVIVGHSERRAYFHETDEMVSKKARAALAAGLAPIVCVGESLGERREGRAEAVVEAQLRGSLGSLSREEMARVVIAYEPVWAIGTGETATPQQAQQMHRFLRRTLGQLVQNSLAEKVKILYGGSVKPDNISALMGESDVDGALVGGASLDPQAFASIVHCGKE